MNFSSSNIWNESLFVRYPIDRIIKINKLFFYKDDDVLVCQNFFEPEIGTKELKTLVDVINSLNKVRFNYINDSNSMKKLKKMADENGFVLEILDSWEAPRLKLESDLYSYIKSNCDSQIKRNYKSYICNKNKYKYYNSDKSDVLKLWQYVLTIDFNSWKKEEQSDMKSLNREDLQYLPFLLLEKNNSNLEVICDLDDNPLAYSLMFRGEDNYWYAVKWGASYVGRKSYAGFYALFDHLENLYNKKGFIKVDFWGRRNKTYDLLKNDTVVRNHILIYKEED